MSKMSISSAIASSIDLELMSNLKFSLDQLMELAGLSVAQAIEVEYPVVDKSRILVICGPGNNGGDGLVAARHLFHFGYSPIVIYPKPSTGLLFQSLVTQLSFLPVPVLGQMPDSVSCDSFDLIIDAIFGFSFKGTIREPFFGIINALNQCKNLPPIASVDIPSGWDVELGNISGMGLDPEMLVSLTYPKNGVLGFKKKHFLGGRFIPPAMYKKHNLLIPQYQKSNQYVDITNGLK